MIAIVVYNIYLYIYLIITIAYILNNYHCHNNDSYLMLNMCQVLSALSTLIYPYFMTEKTGKE